MAEFTNVEIERMHEIVDEFGGDNKPELLKKIKSLVRYTKNGIKCNTRIRIRNFAKTL